jgi:serine/threonine protein kinase
MLTGRRLFSPRKAAAKKYREFSHDDDAIEVPLAESVKADGAVEQAEQFPPGATIAGKYALEKVLGSGRFGTVWLARPQNNDPLDGSYATLSAYAGSLPGASPIAAERNSGDDEWRKARGADDLLDLALNHEHIIEIVRMRGPLPPAMVKTALYRAAYLEEDGALRFRPLIRRISLQSLVRRLARLQTVEAAAAADFLSTLLAVEPSARSSASDALAHPWLHASVGPGPKVESRVSEAVTHV